MSGARRVNFEDRCAELFAAHRRSAFGGTFHVPSVNAYPCLFAWDAGFHALALRWLDPVLAVEELRTLYSANRLESGAIAHERPLPEAAERTRRVELALGPIYREDGRSWLLDPPVAAFAAARLAKALGAPARALLADATLQLDAIWSQRLPPDTGLPVILHPLESGTDGSPLFDDLIESHARDEWCEEIASLTRSAVACRFEPERALRAGHPFVVEDPVFCGWFLVALEEAAAAWEALGDPRATQKLRIRAEMIAEAIVERLWWEPEEIFAGFDRRRGGALTAITAGGLVPAAARSLQAEGRARRALDRHLVPGTTRLWGPKGISFCPIVPDRPFDPDEVLWRGNAVWAAAQYWCHLALLRAQRISEARVARTQLEELVATSGFREFYDPTTGEGRGAGATHGFTWPTLALEMAGAERGT
jgi:hypothetical protein